MAFDGGARLRAQQREKAPLSRQPADLPGARSRRRWRGCATASGWRWPGDRIVEDVDEGRLNIDKLQRKQGGEGAAGAEDVLPRVARECSSGSSARSQALRPRGQAVRRGVPAEHAAGPGSAARSSGSACENELVIATWSPIHLRDEAEGTLLESRQARRRRDGVLGGLARATSIYRGSVTATCWPRRSSRARPAETSSGRRTAQHEGRYDGFKLGDANVQLDDTLLLSSPTLPGSTRRPGRHPRRLRVPAFRWR